MTRLDRLARSTWHLCQIADVLGRQHVGFQVLDQHIDTGNATGRLLFHMLGAIAQFETEIRAKRQMDGIQKAKARGVRFGRKKTLTPAQVAELRQRRAQGDLIKSLMQDYGLSKASIYRYLATSDVFSGRDNATRKSEDRRMHHGQEKPRCQAHVRQKNSRAKTHPFMAVSSGAAGADSARRQHPEKPGAPDGVGGGREAPYR